jgi:hypothetical protein
LLCNGSVIAGIAAEAEVNLLDNGTQMPVFTTTNIKKKAFP